jgi:hypothetical protein
MTSVSLMTGERLMTGDSLMMGVRLVSGVRSCNRSSTGTLVSITSRMRGRISGQFCFIFVVRVDIFAKTQENQ